jgi:hypothetical protein
LNKVPGEDNELLLSHLKQIFNLESTDGSSIEKQDTVEMPTITVNTYSGPPITIKLDKARNKVHVMSRSSNGEFKSLEYDVRQLGQEMVVSTRIGSEESVKDIADEAEKRIEQLIYEFVYHLASSATETRKELSYYCEVLSQDDKFMKVVEEIYEDRNKGFERGYEMLKE